ncbi:uncharacterized protein F4822DRAFT_445370 [Hypoxylon trugodes]|uniref:uncharacterized protein n=1 Tax=Hypoxylon trugodes TaxID=326681 RepID=UPI00219E7AD3|nr:uncharacterized protein F4822DRAFT_445370 [Hypoxylon trugodes]KAI1385421.1 hypothetical protein F4822DRAFT_445370 [Hypoxylon trugodes]
MSYPQHIIDMAHRCLREREEKIRLLSLNSSGEKTENNSPQSNSPQPQPEPEPQSQAPAQQPQPPKEAQQAAAPKRQIRRRHLPEVNREIQAEVAADLARWPLITREPRQGSALRRHGAMHQHFRGVPNNHAFRGGFLHRNTRPSPNQAETEDSGSRRTSNSSIQKTPPSYFGGKKSKTPSPIFGKGSNGNTPRRLSAWGEFATDPLGVLDRRHYRDYRHHPY